MAAGVGDPLSGRLKLELLLRGVRRSKPTNPNARLPITPLILRKVYTILARDPNDEDNIMFRAACCLGFSAFLRSGEFTVKSSKAFDPSRDMSPDDIAVDSTEAPTRMYVRIKALKTDHIRQGVILVVGGTGNDLCPIAAMLPYLVIRAERKGKNAVTREDLVDRSRYVLKEAGIDCSRYSGHSFRIGAATTAAARGISETLGRWARDSFTRYIRIPRDELAVVSLVINS